MKPEQSSTGWHRSESLWRKLKPNARRMRREQTSSEAILWNNLRSRGFLGFQFRRQHPIDRFIVDFYCHEARLVVEVDGRVHQRSKDRDAVRQSFLENRKFRVMRFTNYEIDSDVQAVLESITNALRESTDENERE